MAERRKLTGEQLKSIQLEILDNVVTFCEKNSIRYWLDCGTLLGAVRHKGYIPWDDDIDIGMLRDDYNQFMELFNMSSERYKFYSIENNPKFPYSHGKVLDTHTVLYEPNIYGNKLSVNIDVFVHDNAPDDDSALNKIYKIRDKNRKKLRCRIPYKKYRITGIHSLYYFIRYCLRKIISPCYYAQKIVKNSKRYMNMETDYVGDFVGYLYGKCSKAAFGEVIEAEFEGKKYKIPKGYDEWLTTLYGDYMTPPPIEEQVPHHVFEAYMKGEPVNKN